MIRSTYSEKIKKISWFSMRWPVASLALQMSRYWSYGISETLPLTSRISTKFTITMLRNDKNMNVYSWTLKKLSTSRVRWKMLYLTDRVHLGLLSGNPVEFVRAEWRCIWGHYGWRKYEFYFYDISSLRNPEHNKTCSAYHCVMTWP